MLMRDMMAVEGVDANEAEEKLEDVIEILVRFLLESRPWFWVKSAHVRGRVQQISRIATHRSAI